MRATPTPRNTLVDLYVRLSNADETADSLTRQENDLRAWAERESLTVRTVWSDYGRSGYKKDTRRDGFDAAVKSVLSGEVATLAVWKLDRLSRRGSGHVGTILDALEDVGGRIVFLKDSLDTSIETARPMIVWVSEQSRSESRNTSVRVKSRKEADRRAGRYLGGSAPLGYLVDSDRRLCPNEVAVMTPTETTSEFAMMRELVRRVTEGDTLLAISRDWNARSLPTRRGGAWRPSTLSSALRSPTLVGLMTELVRSEGSDGRSVQEIRAYRDPDTGEHVPLMADGYEPIATVAEQARALLLMDGRLRRYGRGVAPLRTPKSLLGRLAKCASCRRTLTSFGESYRCRKSYSDGSDCALPVSVQVSVLDEAVRRAWARRLAALEPDSPVLDKVGERWLMKFDPAPLAERAEVEREVAETVARLDQADDDHYVRGTLDVVRHGRIAARLAERLDHLRARLSELPQPQADLGALLDPVLSLPAIERTTVVEARDLLGLVIEEVFVSRAPKAGVRFVPTDRLEFTWVGADRP